jgi:hypothetical protein
MLSLTALLRRRSEDEDLSNEQQGLEFLMKNKNQSIAPKSSFSGIDPLLAFRL